MRFKFLDHTADMKFQAFGGTKEEAFASAALALTSIIAGQKVEPVEVRMVQVKGSDEKQLLYNWLEQFLILLSTEGFVLSEVSEISIMGNSLEATLKGDNSSRYALEEDVKAVTYHEMEIHKNSQWVVQVVVDI